jgi:hypothetical protein
VCGVDNVLGLDAVVGGVRNDFGSADNQLQAVLQPASAKEGGA